MDIRRFAPLRAAGATWKEIATEAGCDWRTARKYLSPDAPVGPPRSSSRGGTQPRLVDPFVGVIDGWLVKEPRLRASVIHERLVADYGFTGHYQRIKNYVRDARVRLELEGDPNERPPALHRRFETVAGAQAQVDWGDEGTLLSGSGERRKVYSFHMTLSYSRDPFVCFTHRQDLATFFDCHRRAFAHFGGVPGSIVYDRTKTVVRRHVAPRQAVPLHPQAAAFARALRVLDRRARRLPPDRQGPGGTSGPHRPRPRPGRAGVLQPRGAGRGVRPVGAAAARSGPPHPRGGHRSAGAA
ncbi:MAG: IS21 family transposase [Marmoricola sp.]